MRPLLDALPEPSLLLRPDGLVLHLNPAAAAWLRRAAGSPSALHLADLVEADTATVRALLRQGWRSNQFSPARARWRLGDGGMAEARCELARVAASEHHDAAILLRLKPGPAAGGRFLALTGRVDALSREVARRREAEAELARQSEWLQVVLRSIGDAVVATDLHGGVVLMNGVAEQVCGCTAAEARGRPVERVMALVDADGRPLAVHPVRRALAERRVVGLDPGTQLRALDGRVLPVDDAAGPILDGEGRMLGAVVVFREISERVRAEAQRRELEQQLQVARRMEAIGTLAGGIAHDFNNVLGAILGHAGLALGEVDPAHPVARRLAQIDTAGRRARDLVRQILTFSRRQTPVLQPVDLGTVTRQGLDTLRASLPPGVRLHTDGLDDPPLAVLGDAGQLDRLLLNLVTNACQALAGEGGGLEVSIGIEHGPPPPGLQPGFRPWTGEPRARLTVRDEGAGMDAATLQRIFEPFFTTRPHQGGTGLGLAVVHGIVAEHAGQLAVSSAPGRGTRFDVFLPLAPSAPPPAAAEPPAAPPVNAADRCILVVDDDRVMRMTLAALLRRDGFQVWTCADGAAALAWLDEAAGPVHLLVTDHHMPGMTGLALATEVRRRHPGLPVVLSSGLLSDDLSRGAGALGRVELLPKEDAFDRLPGLVARLLRDA